MLFVWYGSEAVPPTVCKDNLAHLLHTAYGVRASYTYHIYTKNTFFIHVCYTNHSKAFVLHILPLILLIIVHVSWNIDVILQRER